ncbi:hypothetical protein F5146DRAFT_1157673 [Armillaria mellea]|nr:hypothetical protein F5146DRAFT_1157673 [Armillaria mellea]
MYDRFQADRETNGPPLLPGITISSQTEIGQAEECIEVPKQRAYTGSKLVISSSLADTPCSSFGIQGLLDSLNTTLGTSYTLDTPSLSSVLKDCIAKKYDFGTAYGRLRRTWCNQSRTAIQLELWEREAKDINWRRKAVKGSRIVDPRIKPRRVWDLYSNRVVPWWSCEQSEADFKFQYDHVNVERPISHAWVDEVDRVGVSTPINGYEWPVPIPKGWLDVLCMRQRGGPREDLRVEEWKLDVPTIGATYNWMQVVYYLSGLGLPLSLKEGDLESDRSWFRRAWTLQEVGRERIIAGDTPDGPMHAKPIDDAGNYENEMLTRFHKQLKLAETQKSSDIYDVLCVMQDRISSYPIDRVAGLTYTLGTHSIPVYYESRSLEEAWTALVHEMNKYNRAELFFTYPEPGTGHRKWRPSWEQVMTNRPLPEAVVPPAADVGRDNDDCEEGIDRCGELVVNDADGIAHTFCISAHHQYPIPDATCTLLGRDPSPLGHWVVGRRLPNMMFEKVSVFQITDADEGERLEELGLAAMSRSILA